MCMVKTKYGQIRGLDRDSMRLFCGVPYAQPPVGELRFRAPREPLPWKGVLDCTKHKPAAMQHVCPEDISGLSEPYITDFFFDGVPECSEDSLYLTIAAPKDDGPHPVYIWHHGGGLNAGFAYEHEFNPRAFVENGVVVVSMTQRLNVFGFLALPQLAEEGESGNWGLMDELLALKWVKENIAFFGGDPERITVGGQSGGTTKAICLAIAAREKPQRLILESGVKWRTRFPSQEEAWARGKAYLRDLGLPEDITAQELRALPAARLMDPSSPHYSGAMVRSSLLPFDGVQEAFDAGELDGISVLAGLNLGEASAPDGMDETALLTFWSECIGAENAADVRRRLSHLDPGDAARYMAVMGLCRDSGVNQSRNLALVRLFAMEAHRRSAAPVYVYLFSRTPPGIDADKGTERDPDVLWAWHAGELWYAFASLDDGMPPCRPWQPEDFALAQAMNGYFSNFITTGDPNSGPYAPDIAWPCGAGGAYLRLDASIAAFAAGEYADAALLDYTRREFRIGIHKE